MLPVSLDKKKKKIAEGNALCKIMDNNFTGLIEYFSKPSDKTKRHDINEMLLKVALKITKIKRYIFIGIRT
jgi:hypothetical protein